MSSLPFAPNHRDRLGGCFAKASKLLADIRLEIDAVSSIEHLLAVGRSKFHRPLKYVEKFFSFMAVENHLADILKGKLHHEGIHMPEVLLDFERLVNVIDFPLAVMRPPTYANPFIPACDGDFFDAGSSLKEIDNLHVERVGKL